MQSPTEAEMLIKDTPSTMKYNLFNWNGFQLAHRPLPRTVNMKAAWKKARRRNKVGK